jgi:hypothetical protein
MLELGPKAEELYDHRDPRCNDKGGFDLCEDKNLAVNPRLDAVREELRGKLEAVIKTNNRKYWDDKRKIEEKK